MLHACKMLENLDLPLKLRAFDTGVLVLQAKSHSDEKIIQQTNQLVRIVVC